MTSDDALCAEIARLYGWRRLHKTMWRDADDKPHSELPRYDVDPGAALGLLAYVSDLPQVGCVIFGHAVTPGGVRLKDHFCVIEESSGFLGGREMLAEVVHEDRLTAIARACRDALVAIGEQETQTP